MYTCRHYEADVASGRNRGPVRSRGDSGEETGPLGVAVAMDQAILPRVAPAVSEAVPIELAQTVAPGIVLARLLTRLNSFQFVSFSNELITDFFKKTLQ